jgi:hypothetical protein
MNEEDKFTDRVHLVLAALLFGGLLLIHILLLGSLGISQKWQRFWGGGLGTYLICLFVLRENFYLRRGKSRFSNRIMHYLLVLIGIILPVIFLAIFFQVNERIMPFSTMAYGFGGANVAVFVTIFIDFSINKKNT